MQIRTADVTRTAGLGLALVLAAAVAAAQPPAPSPFPRPGGQPPPAPAPPAEPAPAESQPAPQTPPPSAPASTAAPGGPQAPTEAELGMPIYPAAQFLGSYDAGRGQRYYLFGVTIGFAEAVTYYRNMLRERGNLVFETPATHVFEVGRFREETMAFPPSVTVKDYTWGGSAGYPNPVLRGQPERFPTVIQIVPPPRGTQQ